ncbi:MAG: hypothetical protein HC902_06515, partial [Calothrix sp. SM1_5_4]|nr:hypothetical protein [Calothrix sp. SM1_5_4]
ASTPTPRRACAPGGPAEIHFHELFDRLLTRYDLNRSRIKHQSLGQAFSIVVEGHGCFDFVDRRLGPPLIDRIQRQIDEAALFLAEVHAASLGNQVNLLFPIKEISICSLEGSDNRVLAFEQRSLRLGLGDKPVPAAEILRRWNSGNPIRSTEISNSERLPWIGGMLRKWRQSRDSAVESMLRDRIADNWIILNPVGPLRTTALYTLAEAVFKLGQAAGDEPETGLDPDFMWRELLNVARGPGFSAPQRERILAMRARPDDLRGLHSLWRQKLFSAENILSVFENAIGEQARNDQNLHLTLRRVNAGVAVLNDKNIVVRVEQLMDSSIPVSRFSDEAGSGGRTVEITQSETRNGMTTSTTFRIDNVDPRDLTLNADQVNGGVVIDLIDNVIVSVRLPKISPDT